MTAWPWLLLLLGVALGTAQSPRPPGAVRCCGCWNSTEDGAELEVECHCAGQELLDVPSDLDRNVQRITIAEAGLSVLRTDSFKMYSNTLRDIVLMELPSLRLIEAGTFADLPSLRTIYITRAPSLQVLPHGIFSGLSGKLNTLRIMHTGLLHVPDLSQLSNGAIMNMIDLVGNNIRSVHTNALRVKADELLLDYNDIEFVEAWAFNGSEIAKLSLKGNRALSRLSLNAFLGLQSLRDLDLSETAITQLPTGGLEELEVLRIQDTKTLKEIPSVYSFKHLQEAWLTYSFHCCAFKFPAQHDPERHNLQQAYLAKVHELCDETEATAGAVTPETVTADPDHTVGRREARWDSEGTWGHDLVVASTLSPILEHHFDPFHYEPGRGFLPRIETGRSELEQRKPINASAQGGVYKTDFAVHKFIEEKTVRPLKTEPTLAPEDGGVFHQTTAAVPPQQLQALCGNLSRTVVQDILCHPAPDAFNPCEDIMGTAWLRVAVWLVVVTAVLGNLAVIVVLASSRLVHMTVPKFLMCNLAFADLCMGTYLLLIAAMDLHSIGVYFNFALDWQEGLGCKIAGFITVFASQLSIFTLSILTLERWMAITYAMYLNKRLSLRMACNAMMAGWIYSLAMAALPLCGISGYSKTSICLPMETTDVADMTYLIFLLVMNVLAFVVILVCYIQIYLSLDQDTRRGVSTAVIGSPGIGAARGEMNVAKKMALLVFTDLACWAPIAFFGLTAVAGYPLIDVHRSKILLVFFYPLNSCANPFLYAILTSQYRKDLFLLLSRYGVCIRAAQQYKVDGVGSNGQVKSSSSIPVNIAPQPEENSSNQHFMARQCSQESNIVMPNVSLIQANETNTLLKQCIIVQHGKKSTVCVIRNEQETFL